MHNKILIAMPHMDDERPLRHNIELIRYFNFYIYIDNHICCGITQWKIYEKLYLRQTTWYRRSRNSYQRQQLQQKQSNSKLFAVFAPCHKKRQKPKLFGNLQKLRQKSKSLLKKAPKCGIILQKR